MRVCTALFLLILSTTTSAQTPGTCERGEAQGDLDADGSESRRHRSGAFAGFDKLASPAELRSGGTGEGPQEMGGAPILAQEIPSQHMKKTGKEARTGRHC